MFEQINKDLTESMKAKDTFRTSVLRMLKSAIIYEKTNGEKHELTDEDIDNEYCDFSFSSSIAIWHV